MEIRTGFESSVESQVTKFPLFRSFRRIHYRIQPKKIVDFVMGESLCFAEKKHSGAKCAKSVFGKNCAKVAIL